MPEEWERRQRAAETRNLILRIIVGVVFGGLLVAAAVGGVVAWSRRRYAPRLFFAGGGDHARGHGRGSAVNAWPATLAHHADRDSARRCSYSASHRRRAGRAVVTSSLTGLAIGAQPARLSVSGVLAERDALHAWHAAVGAFGAALADLAQRPADAGVGRQTGIAPLGNVRADCSRSRSIRSPGCSRAPRSSQPPRPAFSHITLGWTRRRVAGSRDRAARRISRRGCACRRSFRRMGRRRCRCWRSACWSPTRRSCVPI